MGAIVGWPFDLALALLFMFQELLYMMLTWVAPEAKISWMVQ
jgi:hypothetical protein